MNPRTGFDMFPHHVGGVIHYFHRIQRTSAVPGVKGAVSGLAKKLNLKIIECLTLRIGDFGVVEGMPVEGDINTVKYAGVGHVNFSNNGFFRRCTKELYRPLDTVLFHCALERNGGTH